MKNKIYTMLEKIPSGRLFRIEYITTLPLKADVSKQGFRIEKVTEMTVRTGINYNNIQQVKNLRACGSLCTTDYYGNKIWKVRRRIFFNPNTGKEYIAVAPLRKGSNVDSYYQITFNDGTMSLCKNLGDFKELVIPSYFKPSETGGNIINISLQNIISINGEAVYE